MTDFILKPVEEMTFLANGLISDALREIVLIGIIPVLIAIILILAFVFFKLPKDR